MVASAAPRNYLLWNGRGPLENLVERAADSAPNAARRAEIEKWLAGLLWEFDGSAMLEGEAAEIIMATIEKCLPISEKTLAVPLIDPQELFQEWKKQSD